MRIPQGAHVERSTPLGLVFAGFALLCLGITGMVAVQAVRAHTMYDVAFRAFLAIAGIGGTIMLAYESYSFFVPGGDPTISAITAYTFSKHGPIFVAAVLLLGAVIGLLIAGANPPAFITLGAGIVGGALIAHVTGWRP